MLRVEEFGVATGGGIWVAAGGPASTNWISLNSLQLRRLEIELFGGIARLDLAMGDTAFVGRITVKLLIS